MTNAEESKIREKIRESLSRLLYESRPLSEEDVRRLVSSVYGVPLECVTTERTEDGFRSDVRAELPSGRVFFEFKGGKTVNAETIKTIESILSKGHRVELIPVKDGVRVIQVQRKEIIPQR